MRPPLSPSAILRTAQRRTGIEIEGDPEFHEGMERMTRNVCNSAITPLGRMIIGQTSVSAAVTRAQTEDYLRRHPEVLQRPVNRPIFIVGFPRTGTTLLQNLLAGDPARRALQFWELTSPVPLLDDPEADRQARIRRARRMLSIAQRVAPEGRVMHDIRANSNEECWPLFASNFTVLNFDLQSSLTEYGGWLLDSDMRGPYRRYREQLQMLLEQQPVQNLVLKCPEHMWFLDSLLDVFPDACVVWTHRDPFACIASYCSMISLPHRLWYGHVNNRALGHHITERFLSGVQRAMAVRQEADPRRFYDVSFERLVSDPTAVLRDLLTHFEFPVSSDIDTQVKTYFGERRQDARGKHQYSAARYGLDPYTIYNRYAEYIERFEIPTKEAS